MDAGRILVNELGKDVHIVINGMSAKRMSTIIKNCLDKDMCNTCPYQDRGVACFDALMSDAGLALRRMQVKQDKYRERTSRRIRELEDEIRRLRNEACDRLP